jgi:hypothetical protein
MGLSAAAGFAVVVAGLDEPQSTAVLAALLAMIYGVYLGFALLDGRRSVLIKESLIVATGMVFMVCGVLYDPRWFAIGLLFHGLWDLLHHQPHPRVGADTVPRWYVPFCAVADIFGAAAAILIVAALPD